MLSSLSNILTIVGFVISLWTLMEVFRTKHAAEQAEKAATARQRPSGPQNVCVPPLADATLSLPAAFTDLHLYYLQHAARDAAARGDGVELRRLTSELFDRKQDNWEISYMAASCATDYDQAIRLFDNAIQFGQGHGSLLFAKAKTQALRGKFTDARKTLETVPESERTDEQLFALGMLALRSLDFAYAAKALGVYAQNKPNDALGHDALASALKGVGGVEDARFHERCADALSGRWRARLLPIAMASLLAIFLALLLIAICLDDPAKHPILGDLVLVAMIFAVGLLVPVAFWSNGDDKIAGREPFSDLDLVRYQFTSPKWLSGYMPSVKWVLGRDVWKLVGGVDESDSAILRKKIFGFRPSYPEQLIWRLGAQEAASERANRKPS